MAKRRYPHPETSCRRVKGSLNLSLLNRLEQSPIGARPSTGTRKPEGGVRHESGPRQARHCCENQIIISFHSAANNSYFCLFSPIRLPELRSSPLSFHFCGPPLLALSCTFSSSFPSGSPLIFFRPPPSPTRLSPSIPVVVLPAFPGCAPCRISSLLFYSIFLFLLFFFFFKKKKIPFFFFSTRDQPLVSFSSHPLPSSYSLISAPIRACPWLDLLRQTNHPGRYRALLTRSRNWLAIFLDCWSD